MILMILRTPLTPHEQSGLSCDTIAAKVAWHQQGEGEVKTIVITAVALAALVGTASNVAAIANWINVADLHQPR
jgi:hypothetical protein